ncbi:MAG: hypothetical protein KZQ83_15965 [gamma proteobacterium symbiont of Taylorina sp.]|nr:hypothetical protein [gamma proteobacterium symbiont of Taylorina sp.]
MSLIIDQNNQDLTNELIEHFAEISKSGLSFDTSKSFDTTFIATFKPDFKQLVNYKDVFDDMFNEYALDEFFIDQDNIAYSTFFTSDYGVYGKLNAYGVHNIEHHLNFYIYGLRNDNSIDW